MQFPRFLSSAKATKNGYSFSHFSFVAKLIATHIPCKVLFIDKFYSLTGIRGILGSFSLFTPHIVAA